MRLRYLAIQELPPLYDVAIRFGREDMLGRECTIHFLVGANGSGKTRLLLALAEVFLSLERPRVPPFPVTIAWDVRDPSGRSRTVYLHRPRGGTPAEAIFVEFEDVLPEDAEWETLASADWSSGSTLYPIRVTLPGNELPGFGTMKLILPNTLLAYTSGSPAPWQSLFNPSSLGIDASLDDAVMGRVDPEIESPPGLSGADTSSVAQERLSESAQQEEQPTSLSPRRHPSASGGIGLYLMADDLKLALFAVALRQAYGDFEHYSGPDGEQVLVTEMVDSLQTERPMPGLRGLLNTVGWIWPITVALHLAPRADTITDEQDFDIKRLHELTSAYLSLPGTSHEERISFDLRRRFTLGDRKMSVAEALIVLLHRAGREGEAPDTAVDLLASVGPNFARTVSAFDIFSRLRDWKQAGLLLGLTMMLRKHNVEDALLYDWLSDGERVLLGRMAIFQLLEERENSLVLFDEPETHFNDIWKRRMVDIIDSSMADNPSEIIIATHSSIALTDAFNTEITLLRKLSDGSVEASTPLATSFGGSPTEIMVDILGAPDSVGQRATEFLDLMLVVASYPEWVEAIWAQDAPGLVPESDHEARILASDGLRVLRERVRELPHEYGDDNQLTRRLLAALRGLRREAPVADDATPDVAAALQAFQRRLGAGYYQFEIRRRVRAIRDREAGSRVASN